MSYEKVTLQPTLTARSIILMIMLSIVSPILGELMYRYTTKPYSFGGIFILNLFWMILLSQLFGKINKKWRLSSAELLVLFLPLAWCSGKYMLIQGTPTPDESIMRNLNSGIPLIVSALTDELYKQYFATHVPNFMFPAKNSELVRILYHGKSIGETVPWSQLAVPIAYWTTLQILLVLLTTSLVFIVNKPWVEIERLNYSYGVGAIYLVGTIETTEANRGLSRLFTKDGLKDPRVKAFWASFFTLGLIFNVIPVLAEFIPEIAFGAEWGHMELYIPMPRGVMPGGMWVTALVIPFLVVPMDILYTHLLMFLIVGVLYPVIGLQMGWIPWTEAMGKTSHYWFILGQQEPFPFRIIANTGVMLGIAVWHIWHLRERFKLAFSTITGGKDIIENGLSLRSLAFLTIFSFIGLLVLGIVSGVPFIIMFLWLLLYIAWRICGWRVWAEATTMDTHHFYQNLHLGLIYPVGVALNYWQHPPPPGGNPSSLLVWNAIVNVASGGANARQAFWGGDGLSIFYRLSHGARANFKHIIIAIIISSIISTVIGQVFDIWIFAHGGGISRVNAEGASGAVLASRNVLTPDPVETRAWPKRAYYGAIGFIITIIIYILRMRYTWFFINPIGVLVGLWCSTYAWINSLVVVVIRLIATRLVGARKYEEYAWPVAAGAFASIMALYPIFAIHHFLTVSWPRFTALFVP